MTPDQVQAQRTLNLLIIRSVKDEMLNLVKEHGGSAQALSLAKEIGEKFEDGYHAYCGETGAMSPSLVPEYARMVLRTYVFDVDAKIQKFRDSSAWLIVKFMEFQGAKRIQQYEELKTIVEGLYEEAG